MSERFQAWPYDWEKYNGIPPVEPRVWDWMANTSLCMVCGGRIRWSEEIQIWSHIPPFLRVDYPLHSPVVPR